MNNSPLADLLRPKTLNEFIGQDHLVGKNGIIKTLIEKDNIVSMIFWGPPGVGKTTLARLVAQKTKSDFIAFSAVTATLDDLRKVVKRAGEVKKAYSKRTILFIDEIHRFNRLQQDAFLPHVESGTIILIGATTENPSFEVIGPLLSRCRVFVLTPLNDSDLKQIAQRVLKFLKITALGQATEVIVSLSNGDARSLINIIEILYNAGINKITIKSISQAVQNKLLQYDQTGEKHYNSISAFIKSMRASDVNAALYYLARMVEAGEDPLFIARRMVIFASEDIGLAQPTALVVANQVFEACQKIGYPECQINLAHGVTYLCQAKKDRSAYNAYMEALDDVKKFGNLPIPLIVRNAPTKLMKDLGYGKGYQRYTKESLLPEKLKNKKYYNV